MRLRLLHASYGQRTERRELQSFHALADHFGAVKRLAVRLDYFSAIGGSSLTDSRMPIRDADLASREIPNTYVPFRNAHFLSIATSWAEVLGADEDLYRRGLGRQFGISGLQAGILRGDESGDPRRNAAVD